MKKYRIWEPVNEEMSFVNVALYYEEDNGSKRFVLPEEHQGGLKSSYTVMNLDAVVVMLPIGVVDRIRNELYDGDIVTFKCDYDTFENYDIGKIEWDKNNLQWVITGCQDSSNDMPLCEFCDNDVADLKQIGNIYENANLLDYRR